MRRQFQLFIVLTLLVTTACRVSDAGFRYGLIQLDCAPNDAIEIDLRLTAEPAQCKQALEPYLQIAIWRGRPIRVGKATKFGKGSNTDFASRCRRAGECEQAESGELIFDRYSDNKNVSGTYEFHFRGDTIRGHFDAKWCQNHFLCG